MIAGAPNKTLQIKRIIRIITCVYLLFIGFVIFCATNNYFVPQFNWVQRRVGDKSMHFVLVGLLAFLVNLSLGTRLVRLGWLAFPTGSLALILLTTMEEFSQKLFPNRTFDLLDLACNLAGILVLGSLALPIAQWLGIRKQNLATDLP